jgi:hypothetical protein
MTSPAVFIYVSTAPLEPALAAIAATQAQILLQLNQITQGVKSMGIELDALTAQVAQNETVEESALALINGLAAQIAAAATNPAALTALSASLKTNADALAAAVAANTPAAPVVPPATGL